MLYRILSITFQAFFTLLFRARIIGRENMPQDGAVILAANHMSNWDPPLVAAFLSRPVSYMAKLELFQIPVFGRAITACHAFPRQARRC
jgi:1-acyl-sn-glycerol-3-phosphate acyltransferase